MMQMITNETEYRGGLFPTIPSQVPGQDTLLIGEDGIPRLVDNYLSTRDIRKGNYIKIARVSTAMFTIDISLKATSGNSPYQFDITIGIDCRVSNSVAYYMSRSAYNIESSINTALLRFVAPEAKRFELVDESVSDAILHKLKEKEQYFLENLGITYAVVSVNARPDADAEQNFIKKMTDQRLNVMVEQNKITETGKLMSRNMEDAIIGQVADGKIDMKTALEQLSSANRSEGYNKLEDMERLFAFVRKLQKDNLISDDEAGQRVNELLSTLPLQMSSSINPMDVKSTVIEEKPTASNDNTLDDLLADGGAE